MNKKHLWALLILALVGSVACGSDVVGLVRKDVEASGIKVEKGWFESGWPLTERQKAYGIEATGAVWLIYRAPTGRAEERSVRVQKTRGNWCLDPVQFNALDETSWGQPLKFTLPKCPQ